MKAKDDSELRHQTLLCEYQAAQDSAHHHDSLLWTTVSVVGGAMLVLLGFVLDDPKEMEGQPVFVAVGLLGIVLVVTLVVLVVQFNGLMNLKYTRCKELEEELGMKHHLEVRHLRGSQKALLSVIGLFLMVIWIWVLALAG